jgi:hypothetical protein
VLLTVFLWYMAAMCGIGCAFNIKKKEAGAAVYAFALGGIAMYLAITH